SVFAFRSSEQNEVASVLALLGLEQSAEHKAVLRALGNGECIFRDLDGRAGRIGVDLISDDLRQSLDTNPTRARPGDVPAGQPAAGPAQPAAMPVRSEPVQSESAQPAAQPEQPGADRPA
ncbi:MAG TPA: ATP-binding protein, partial [Streptosporangiaceae bacterium]